MRKYCANIWFGYMISCGFFGDEWVNLRSLFVVSSLQTYYIVMYEQWQHFILYLYNGGNIYLWIRHSFSSKIKRSIAEKTLSRTYKFQIKQIHITLLYRAFINDELIFKDVNVHEKLMIVCYINYGLKMLRLENTWY